MKIKVRIVVGALRDGTWEAIGGSSCSSDEIAAADVIEYLDSANETQIFFVEAEIEIREPEIVQGVVVERKEGA